MHSPSITEMMLLRIFKINERPSNHQPGACVRALVYVHVCVRACACPFFSSSPSILFVHIRRYTLAVLILFTYSRSKEFQNCLRKENLISNTEND